MLKIDSGLGARSLDGTDGVKDTCKVPDTRLKELKVKRDELEAEIRREVDARRADGFTWQQIADALGVSRQAAQQRYGK